MKSISSIIRKTDFLAEVPKIKIFNKNKYSTIIGGILSTLAVLAILTLSLYFIIKLFLRDSINIVYNIEKSPNQIYNFTERPILFALSDPYGPLTLKDSDTYYTITADYRQTIVLKNGMFGTNDCSFDMRKSPHSVKHYKK